MPVPAVTPTTPVYDSSIREQFNDLARAIKVKQTSPRHYARYRRIFPLFRITKNKPYVLRTVFLGDITGWPCLGWVGSTPRPQVLKRIFLVPEAEFTFQERCRGRVRQPLTVDHLRRLSELFLPSNRPSFVPIITLLLIGHCQIAWCK